MSAPSTPVTPSPKLGNIEFEQFPEPQPNYFQQPQSLNVPMDGHKVCISEESLIMMIQNQTAMIHNLSAEVQRLREELRSYRAMLCELRPLVPPPPPKAFAIRNYAGPEFWPLPPIPNPFGQPNYTIPHGGYFHNPQTSVGIPTSTTSQTNHRTNKKRVLWRTSASTAQDGLRTE
jgi:hypothetical protein